MHRTIQDVSQECKYTFDKQDSVSINPHFNFVSEFIIFPFECLILMS